MAKGKINVYETDTNSMKLEKWLLFEIGPRAFICTSMTATAILVLFVIVSFLDSGCHVDVISYIRAVLTNISRRGGGGEALHGCQVSAR